MAVGRLVAGCGRNKILGEGLRAFGSKTPGKVRCARSVSTFSGFRHLGWEGEDADATTEATWEHGY